MKALLDTSVFVAREQERPLGELPEEAAISVVTLAELHLGVLMAKTDAATATRLRTLSAVERTFDAIDIDSEVARSFAVLVAQAKKAKQRPKILDTLVAATALVNDLTVYTQDTDFNEIPSVSVKRI